jgi:hypothetical protein
LKKRASGEHGQLGCAIEIGGASKLLELAVSLRGGRVLRHAAFLPALR